MSKLIQVAERFFSIKTPVSIREFIESSDYLGDDTVYEYWKDELEALPSNLTELLLDGSLGGGKSFAAALYISYRVYCLFLNGDPRPTFGMGSSTPLYVLYFSTSMKNAQRSGFKYLRSVFEQNTWFKNNMPVDDSIESVIRFKDQNFEILPVAAEHQQTGLNVWGFILDESNFREGVGSGVSEEYEEVTFLYEQLSDRLASRFSTPGGVNAISVLISSASYQSSFTEKRKPIIKENPTGRVITTVAYKVKPWQYSEEMFEVFIGAGAIEAQIIESDEQKHQLMKMCGYEGLGKEDELFIKVPLNLKPNFQSNLPRALQNHAGVPTHIKGRFMSDLRFLYASYVEGILPIFTSTSLEASTADNTQLIEYLIEENIVYPERPHSLFIDLSLKGDTAGITCYRFDGLFEGKKIHTKVFTLGIVPPAYPAMTRISKVQQFVVDLAQVINIVAVGSDQFQSSGMRQEITAALNLEDIRLSIDSTDKYHLHWQRALVDGRIRSFKDSRIEKEVEEAEHDLKRHRVLKRDKSTDDLFQTEVGAFWLSDTIGAFDGDISTLYEGRIINIVGENSANAMLSKFDKSQTIGVLGLSVDQMAKKLGYRINKRNKY